MDELKGKWKRGDIAEGNNGETGNERVKGEMEKGGVMAGMGWRLQIINQ